MAGLFVTSLSSTQLSYYFNGIASGKEDLRTGLDPDDVSYIGNWGQMDGSPPQLADILRDLRGIPSDRRFVRKVKNVAYDLCIVAPKQLSIMFGLLPVDLSKEVLEAHKCAVAAMVDNFTPTLVWGTGSKLSAVGFVHRTSRLLDPHLHTHLIVANRVEVSPGVFRALDSSELYGRVGEWSHFYGRSLAKEVHSRLGLVLIERNLVGDSIPLEIPGFPKELSELFSKRSRQVSELVAAWGTSSSRAARAASLMTRAQKIEVDSSILRQRWSREMKQAGFNQAVLEGLLPIAKVHSREIYPSPKPRDGRSLVEAFEQRVQSPSRGDGSIQIATFDRDLYSRLGAFSLGKIVDVVGGGKRRREYLPLGTADAGELFLGPVEVVVFGRIEREIVAELALKHRHQDLILAFNSEFFDKGWLGGGLTIVNSHFGRGSGLRGNSSEAGSRSADLASELKSAIEKSADFLSRWSLQQGFDSHIVMPTKLDRDLAREEIAHLMQRSLDDCGFYNSEPVWIHYLPKEMRFGAGCIGEIDLAGESVRYINAGSVRSVPLSELNVKTMLSPLSVMTRSDVRRSWGRKLSCEVGLGEFACTDKSLQRFELHSSRRLPKDRDLFLERESAFELEGVERSRLGKAFFDDSGFWRAL